MKEIDNTVLAWAIDNYILNQDCTTCKLREECDRYETLVGYETGKYMSICDILDVLTK